MTDGYVLTGGVLKVKDDPQFANYFKMVRMQIPRHAIKNRMIMAGIDPELLEYVAIVPAASYHRACCEC